MVNVWSNLSPIPLSKRITVTLIDVKYECDVNAVTLLNNKHVKIIIFTLHANVIYKSHDYRGSFLSYTKMYT